jgi:hypothetical protein
MREYDLYINPKKPAVGLYVRRGVGLPDLSDAKDWIFDGTSGEDVLPANIITSIEAAGHAFRDMN